MSRNILVTLFLSQKDGANPAQESIVPWSESPPWDIPIIPQVHQNCSAEEILRYLNEWELEKFPRNPGRAMGQAGQLSRPNAGRRSMEVAQHWPWWTCQFSPNLNKPYATASFGSSAAQCKQFWTLKGCDFGLAAWKTFQTSRQMMQFKNMTSYIWVYDIWY